MPEWIDLNLFYFLVARGFLTREIENMRYYANIKWYINQRKFGSFNINLSHAEIFVALIYEMKNKTKLSEDM